MNKGKNLFLWLAILVVITFAYNVLNDKIGQNNYSNYAFSEFLTKVEDGQISDVIIQNRTIQGHFNDGTSFTTYILNYPGLVEKLKSANIKFEAAPETKMNPFFSLLSSLLPILPLIFILFYVMRQMQGGGGKAMGFGKSKARLLTEKTGKVTFDDVAGIDEAKDELAEIVDFLKDPKKYQVLGGKIPRGCLLVGSPGTGKTLLARAIAGEANVPFFTISGSDFVEMFVGVGASRVRDMFEQGKKNAPCIIFMDEIDAVGRHRGMGMGGGNDEREQTLNQLLVEMDGFESNEGVIIIAATNRPDVLDPALLRPGRFDRQIIVPLPDIKGREKILNVHLKKIPMGPDVNPHVIARGTPGFSGADLANLVNEAALLSARTGKKVITMYELESAKDKVMMGAERKSMVMSDSEKRLTAFHEGGHALVAIFCPASDPVHKATIIPRGRALGLVMRLPETDRLSVTREKLKADLAVAMGGRAAEVLIFGYDNVTSGASSDIQQATKMARSMVTEWGMSDKLGPIFYGGDNQDSYLSGSSKQHKGYSEETSNNIDDEVKQLVEEGYDLALKILTDNKTALELIATNLLEYETLSGDEIKDIIAGKKLDRQSSTKYQGSADITSYPTDNSNSNKDSSEPLTTND